MKNNQNFKYWAGHVILHVSETLLALSIAHIIFR
uniref:Uncharacterized protein n=1 Tax=Siphoviridae sp. ctFPV4 TaxID=2827819 RepID=A0A8S5SJ86_9CAUD|nr:MAG TPA: hypothetical protein [Siphoviridae sp. ctFPV4]DAR03863.1 MAG TPA: hypothetical protein [Caudoviricetes sp.]